MPPIVRFLLGVPLLLFACLAIAMPAQADFKDFDQHKAISVFDSDAIAEAPLFSESELYTDDGQLHSPDGEFYLSEPLATHHVTYQGPARNAGRLVARAASAPFRGGGGPVRRVLGFVAGKAKAAAAAPLKARPLRRLVGRGC